MASSGRRPVLALLSAEQVPVLGLTPAVRGLATGVEHALRLAVYHAPVDVQAFADVLLEVRSSARFDFDFSRAFAAGYTLAASEVRRIGGLS
jgi:hypothetical protein